jgi:hypothetical protein
MSSAEKARMFQTDGLRFLIWPAVNKENMAAARITDGEKPVIAA